MLMSDHAPQIRLEGIAIYGIGVEKPALKPFLLVMVWGPGGNRVMLP